MNRREQAKRNRKIAMRVFRQLAKGGRSVTRTEWERKVAANPSVKSSVYNAVHHCIENDQHVKSGPKAKGTARVYFYSQGGNVTTSSVRKGLSAQEGAECAAQTGGAKGGRGHFTIRGPMSSPSANCRPRA